MSSLIISKANLDFLSGLEVPQGQGALGLLEPPVSQEVQVDQCLPLCQEVQHFPAFQEAQTYPMDKF